MRYIFIAIALTGIISLSFLKAPLNHPEQKSVYYKWDEFSMGVDLSYVNQVEDYGGIYRDSGQIKDPFQIMKAHGANTVRVRLWHTPTDIAKRNNGKMYYDLQGVEKTIFRAKKLGMAVNLDIHYSDTWADPAHQSTPAAWKNLNYDLLKDSVYQYTLSILQYLQQKNLVPEMVQVGNETNGGMLWPVGKVTKDNWVEFSGLLNSGIKAVRDFSKNSTIKPRIILHVAQLQNAEYWIKGITSNSVKDFDIIGLSHYAKWSKVSSFIAIEEQIRQLKNNYSKDVMVVETAYPWTGQNADKYNNIFSTSDSIAGYPVTQHGQFKYLRDLTQAIINGGGKGIMYWEPAWISSKLNDGWGTGSSWENASFFDFEGNTTPVIDYMKYPYSFTKK